MVIITITELCPPVNHNNYELRQQNCNCTLIFYIRYLPNVNLFFILQLTNLSPASTYAISVIASTQFYSPPAIIEITTNSSNSTIKT